jgi:hypothetical protein
VTELDTLKILVALFDREDDEDGVNECGFAWDDLEQEEGGLDVLEMEMEEDPDDKEWIPPELRARIAKQREPGASQA